MAAGATDYYLMAGTDYTPQVLRYIRDAARPGVTSRA